MSVKLLDFSDPLVRLDPYPEYRRMRDSCPVAFDEAQKTWYVFRYADVKAVISNPADFSNDTSGLLGAPPTPLIHFDPPTHTKQRALINKAFSPRMVAAVESQISAITHRLIDRVQGSGRIELVHDFASALPVSVLTAMMGIPEEDSARVKLWADKMAMMANSLSTGKPQFFPEIMEMLQYLSALVLQRKEAPGEDLVSALWQAEVDGQSLDMGEVLGFCVLLYFAGTESTSNLLTTSIATLLQHPEILAEVRSNPALLSAVTEEMLRYRAPSQAVYRMARRDVELGGQCIRSGQVVIPLLGSANHDESVFTSPERFDIRRTPNPQLSFGHGIHFCLGAALTRMEARIGLGALLQRLTNLTLVDEGPLEPLDSYFFYGYKRLPLAFTPAPPSIGPHHWVSKGFNRSESLCRGTRPNAVDLSGYPSPRPPLRWTERQPRKVAAVRGAYLCRSQGDRGGARNKARLTRRFASTSPTSGEVFFVVGISLRSLALGLVSKSWKQ